MTGNPAESAIRKASRRLIPFLVLCYAVNFLDRVNVGFAALAMNRISASRPRCSASAPASSLWLHPLRGSGNLALAKFGARIGSPAS
jgi:hypothetical protein